VRELRYASVTSFFSDLALLRAAVATASATASASAQGQSSSSPALPLMHSFDTLVDCCHMYLTSRSAAISVVQDEIDKQAADGVVLAGPSNAPTISSSDGPIYTSDSQPTSSTRRPTLDICKNESKNEIENKGSSISRVVDNINENVRPLKRVMDGMVIESKRARSATSASAPVCGGMAPQANGSGQAAADPSSMESRSQLQSIPLPLQQHQNGSSRPKNVTDTAALERAQTGEALTGVDGHGGSPLKDSEHSVLAACLEEESSESMSMSMSDTQNSTGSQETADLDSVDVLDITTVPALPLQCASRTKEAVRRGVEAGAVVVVDSKCLSSIQVPSTVCPAAPAPSPSRSSSIPGMFEHPSKAAQHSTYVQGRAAQCPPYRDRCSTLKLIGT
jgi:hypothetical protein